MPLPERTVSALWDMWSYAREIRDTVGGISLEVYVANRTLRFATERRLEIVGEAARRVPEDFRRAHPEIPWRQVIGLRNILAHEYGEVRQEVIHTVATVHIPELIRILDPFVSEPRGESESPPERPPTDKAE
jgi:uncharacterized protein with HEPN domain